LRSTAIEWQIRPGRVAISRSGADTSALSRFLYVAAVRISAAPDVNGPFGAAVIVDATGSHVIAAPEAAGMANVAGTDISSPARTAALGENGTSAEAKHCDCRECNYRITSHRISPFVALFDPTVMVDIFMTRPLRKWARSMRWP
jgi:hypothetical protein